MSRETSEDTVRDHLMTLLFQRIGEPATMSGMGESARFDIKAAIGGGTCAAERTLHYRLPSGRVVPHKNDILVSLPNEKHVALEIKFLSAVTDQFKTRSYDMLHLKQAFGGRLIGIMIYLHAAGVGIGIENARAICYPFDYFFGLEAKDNPLGYDIWRPVIEAVETEILSP